MHATRLVQSVVPGGLLVLSALAQEPVWDFEFSPGTDTWILDVVPLVGGGAIGVAENPFGGGPISLLHVGGQGDLVQGTPFTGLTLGRPFAGAVDGSGGAFLVTTDYSGAIGGPSLGGGDALVLRFDSDGQLRWARRFGGSGTDVALDVVADGSGGAYVVGQTSSADFGAPSPGPTDGFIARLDGTGQVVWVSRVGEVGRDGRLGAVTLDQQGAPLCGGSFDDLTTFPIFPTGIAAGFDAAGTRRFLHPLHPFGGTVIAIAPNGPGYVELATLPYGGYLCTGRDTGGAPQWDVRLDAGNAASTQASDLVRRENGTFLLGGTTAGAGQQRHLRAFGPTGSVLWDLPLPHPIGRGSDLVDLHIDGVGSVFASGALRPLPGTPTANRIDGWVGRIALDDLGAPECAGQPNSTGAAATSRLVGSAVRSANQVTVFTHQLPTTSVGYYLTSTDAGFVPGAGGSQGDLCLGGTVGRFNRAGEVQSADASGHFHLVLNLGDIPQPTGWTSALAGETWRFQSWYRDANPGPTSNFSSAVAVTLL